MKIWLAKNSEVSVREQLITQIMIAVASGDLAIDEKLPSTKEISRRFQIHSNTVSLAYQELVEKGWLDFRQGSGFFVKENKGVKSANLLDGLIYNFLQTTQKQGFTLSEIENRISEFFKRSTSNHLVVIESDDDLREILMNEISEAIGVEVSGITNETFRQNPHIPKAIFVAMPDEAANINKVLPPDKICFFLKTSSVADSLKKEMRPGANDLIAIVSGWEKFLILAKIMLLAANIDAENLIIRQTNQPNWQRGLEECSLVICDSLSAKKLQFFQQLRVFNLISETSIQDLKNTLN